MRKLQIETDETSWMVAVGNGNSVTEPFSDDVEPFLIDLANKARRQNGEKSASE